MANAWIYWPMGVACVAYNSRAKPIAPIAIGGMLNFEIALDISHLRVGWEGWPTARRSIRPATSRIASTVNPGKTAPDPEDCYGVLGTFFDNAPLTRRGSDLEEERLMCLDQ